MANNNDREIRRIKLSPRVGLESEDENIYNLQSDIDIQISEIKKEVLDDEYLDEGEETVMSPPKFSIKVEVEEYADEQPNNVQLENDTLFLPVTKSMDVQGQSHVTDIPEDLYDSNIESKYRHNTLYLFDRSKTDVCLVADRIARTTNNVADNILAREVRNLCSVLMKSYPMQETDLLSTQIYSVYKQWKTLCTTSKYYEQPLFYKCYICEKSWWYLGPFMDHAKEHDSDLYFIYLEMCRPFVCNIVLANNEYEPEKFIQTEGDCWRCGKPYNFHEKMKSTDLHYKCRGCLKCFYKCKTLHDHENTCSKIPRNKHNLVCKICLYSFESYSDLVRHLHSCHIVRSDLFMWSTYKKCHNCKEKFYITCKKCSEIRYNFVCELCCKRFSSQILLESHKSCTQNDVKCKICNAILPKRCMEVQHYITHTDMFKLVYTCSLCTDVFLFLEKHSMIMHHSSWHKDNDVQNPRYELVLIPTVCIDKLKRIEPDPNGFAVALGDNTAHAETPVGNTDAFEIKEEIIETEYVDEDNDKYYVIEENNSTYDELMANMFQGTAMGNQQVKTEIKVELIDPDYEGGSRELDDDEEESRLIIDMQKSDKMVKNKKKRKNKKPKLNSPKIYKCCRCGYQGFHKDYKDHVVTTCVSSQRRMTRMKCVMKNISPHRCGHCKVTFTSLNGYLRHFAPSHGHRELACPVCFDDFTDQKLRLYAHFNFHVKQTFLKLKVIDSHNMSSDKTDSRYECKVCRKTVEDGEFFSHWEGHFTVKHIADDDDGGCRSSAVIEMTPSNLDLEELITKLLSIHSSYRERTCTLCDRHFHRINDSKRHLIEHLLVDAYRNKIHDGCLRCQICKEAHGKADEYKKHLRDHASLPIYQCEICNKSFSDSSNFVKHKKIHNTKVLICDICKHKYQAKASLEKHMRIHMEMKPIVCKMCTKIFHTASSYKKHYKSSHEKHRTKFKCTMCNLRFDSLKMKWDHMWLVHNERKIKADCPICDKRFRKNHDVKVHIRTDHNMVEVKPTDIRTDDYVVVKYLKKNYCFKSDDVNETLIVYD